jgi:hypothetical protein
MIRSAQRIDRMIGGVEPSATTTVWKSYGSLGRVIAYAISWPSSGTNTVTIKPLGTSGHARIDVDEIVIVR